MATYVHARSKTFEASEAIAQHLRTVLANTGLISVAGAADDDIGTAARPTYAAGDDVAVNLATGEGTTVYISAVVAQPGDKAYGAADGKITNVAGGKPIGIYLSDAVVDGQAEVLRRQI